MKTIRRDQLLKLAKAGKLVAIESYHFDDQDGAERRKDIQKPVRVAEYGDFKDGFYNLFESDFKSSCGYAYLNDDGTVHLTVHGNCTYDFRLIDGATIGVANKNAPKARRPENQAMQNFLAKHGIEATAKYAWDGSMRGTWRLYNPKQQWSLELAEKLTALGFVSCHNEPLGEFSGNGGSFSVSVRGHNELLQAAVPEDKATEGVAA